MIGQIKKINNNSIGVKFDEIEEIKKITYEDFYSIKMAYLITIHKSQGSEADNVIIIINDSKVNNINLLYTSITRAKKRCILIAKTTTIENIIKNKKKVDRESNLSNFIKDLAI